MTLTDHHVNDWQRKFLSAAGDRPAISAFGQCWPLAYIAEASPDRATTDAAVLLDTDAETPGISLVESARGQARFTISVAERPRSLADLLPLLQSLGLEVLSEQPFRVTRPDGVDCWLYDFHIAASSLPPEPTLTPRLEEAFCAMWRGDAEVDPYNRLVVAAGLTWREVAIMRTYGQYLHQLQAPWGRTSTANVLAANGQTTQRLARLFTLRFGRPVGATLARDEHSSLQLQIEADIDSVENLAADRLLRSYLEAILATVRTNAFDDGFDGKNQAIALKFDPSSITAMQAPRPQFEVFVASPRIEGIHLRFGAVARGGLRWSDRHEDLRTEVLGLATAQVAKNAVIVPTGAKGGFVIKHPTGPGAGERGLAAYQEFIAALLDVHDNLDLRTGKPRRDPGAVTYDCDDAYLVVAADKGTATFSDAANKIAVDRGFWLGDAFASGGSTGYDHKAMGITAKGAWRSVRRHFREIGVDADNDRFTAVGIGDMSGDVFGNGMLLSRHLKLVAAFDHRHIFLDPDPEPESAHAERSRLFALDRSTWADYAPQAISAGGGVHPRTVKSIQVSAEVRRALGLPDTTTAMTPTELIRAILAAPVDLLWNGGIGTYVKATTEQHVDAGDKTNDLVRLDATAVRARVVGEGGNLGFTQRARIEYALAGGRINTDALDNSAGVGCSDREVNIKIALQQPIRDGMSEQARVELLASMTTEVARLVLAQNDSLNLMMGQSRQFAADDLALHARLLSELERRRGLDLVQLALPTAAEVAERAATGAGLTSPELAVLSAQVKLDLRDSLLESPLPDDPAVRSILLAYFPTSMRELHRDAIDQHPLRREIIATELANTVVDRAGIGWVHRILENTTATMVDVVRAYLVTSAVFDFAELWRRINADDIPAHVAGELIWESTRLLDRASRWLLNRRPQPLQIEAEIARLRPTVDALFASVPTWHHSRSHIDYQERLDLVVAGGADPALAAHVFGLLEGFCLLDIAETAHELSVSASQVAPLYYLVKERREIDHLLTGISQLPRNDRWSALARLGLRDDLYESIRAIVTSILRAGRVGETATEALDRSDSSLGERLAKIDQLVLASKDDHRLANLAVAARQIRTLALLSR